MDRSFGSSTSTLLATPTPLERKSRTSLSSSTFLANNQLAQSINAGTSSSSSVLQPLTFQRSTTALSGPTTKAVRFSPAHPSTTGGFSNAYSSAPSSRVQSIATPPRSQSSPSLSALNRTSSYGLGSGAAATPPRPQQVAQQVQQKVQAAVGDPGKAVQEIKQKLQVTPIGRGEAARRLRVNAVLLVAWWVSSRTAGYRFAAGHLVALLPVLDTPLLVVETLLLFLLGWNILDSLRALQKLSALPSNQSTVNPTLTSPLSLKPGPIRPPSNSSISSPVRSSPKTRAHPSPLVSRFVSPSKSTSLGPSTSPFRSSSLASSSPPTPQTPTSALNRSANVTASALSRRSLGGGGLTGSPVGTSSPLGRSMSAGGNLESSTPKKGGAEEINGALLAYEARHSPSASPRVSLNTEEEIDRLFE